MITGKISSNLDAVIEVEVGGQDSLTDAKYNCLVRCFRGYSSGRYWDDLRVTHAARRTKNLSSG